MSVKTLTVMAVAVALAAATCRMWGDISYQPFSAKGAGGQKNRQEFRIGPGGTVYELDAFLLVAGTDLNGEAPGTAAQLSRHELPAGLGYEFSAVASTEGADLVLTYRFTNSTETAFAGLRLLVLLDAEIDEGVNTFFNEYGTVRTIPRAEATGPGADQWQIGEPGYRGGDLYRNLFQGSLGNTNGVPEASPEDVALALGFSLGSLKAGEGTTVRVLISEAGHVRGTVALEQRDLAAGSATVITLSGETDVKGATGPQNVSALASLAFQWRLKASSGSLMGTVTLANRAESGTTLGPPFQLGLGTTAKYWLAHPEGKLPDDVPYVDLTAMVAGKLGAGVGLAPGQSVTVGEVEVLSRDRVAPAAGQFELWATPGR